MAFTAAQALQEMNGKFFGTDKLAVRYRELAAKDIVRQAPSNSAPTADRDVRVLHIPFTYTANDDCLGCSSGGSFVRCSHSATTQRGHGTGSEKGR